MARPGQPPCIPVGDGAASGGRGRGGGVGGSLETSPPRGQEARLWRHRVSWVRAGRRGFRFCTVRVAGVGAGHVSLSAPSRCAGAVVTTRARRAAHAPDSPREGTDLCLWGAWCLRSQGLSPFCWIPFPSPASLERAPRLHVGSGPQLSRHRESALQALLALQARKPSPTARPHKQAAAWGSPRRLQGHRATGPQGRPSARGRAHWTLAELTVA